MKEKLIGTKFEYLWVDIKVYSMAFLASIVLFILTPVFWFFLKKYDDKFFYDKDSEYPERKFWK